MRMIEIERCLQFGPNRSMLQGTAYVQRDRFCAVDV